MGAYARPVKIAVWPRETMQRLVGGNIIYNVSNMGTEGPSPCMRSSGLHLAITTHACKSLDHETTTCIKDSSLQMSLQIKLFTLPALQGNRDKSKSLRLIKLSGADIELVSS